MQKRTCAIGARKGRPNKLSHQPVPSFIVQHRPLNMVLGKGEKSLEHLRQAMHGRKNGSHQTMRFPFFLKVHLAKDTFEPFALWTIKVIHLTGKKSITQYVEGELKWDLDYIVLCVNWTWVFFFVTQSNGKTSLGSVNSSGTQPLSPPITANATWIQPFIPYACPAGLHCWIPTMHLTKQHLYKADMLVMCV